jgi:hypothetical protein
MPPEKTLEVKDLRALPTPARVQDETIRYKFVYGGKAVKAKVKRQKARGKT